MANSPYAAADDAKLDEIIRLAEARLAAQLTVGLAADQRAMTFASILGAVEAAAIAGLGTISAGSAFKPVMLVLVVGVGIAAILALISARPITWDIPGNSPRQWLNDIPSGDTLKNGKAAMAGFYDEMIHDNHAALEANGDTLTAALLVVGATLVAAGGLAIAFS